MSDELVFDSVVSSLTQYVAGHQIAFAVVRTAVNDLLRIGAHAGQRIERLYAGRIDDDQVTLGKVGWTSSSLAW